MERKVATLQSLIVPQVGTGRMSGLWISTELWMIKVQTLTSQHNLKKNLNHITKDIFGV